MSLVTDMMIIRSTVDTKIMARVVNLPKPPPLETEIDLMLKKNW